MAAPRVTYCHFFFSSERQQLPQPMVLGLQRPSIALPVAVSMSRSLHIFSPQACHMHTYPHYGLVAHAYPRPYERADALGRVFVDSCCEFLICLRRPCLSVRWFLGLLMAETPSCFHPSHLRKGFASVHYPVNSAIRHHGMRHTLSSSSPPLLHSFLSLLSPLPAPLPFLLSTSIHPSPFSHWQTGGHAQMHARIVIHIAS
mmetsp:Transcript_58501/g.127061  ORF Transcript_58501/g.127061 Transcript_58501/m.127061 type:complete len:201 (-) Transcript_58501:19-621(-)